MPYSQFFVVALICALETYFFNQAVMTGNYLLALFWGLMLLRNLRRVQLVSRLTKRVMDQITKKKD
ncbi:DUF3272 family protein [Streptococcus pluranimalium]|uniref:DUF3272 family protein n=1 Tax=Streptococcus pluranimalium TaxID=82348 RepID=UPI003F68E544